VNPINYVKHFSFEFPASLKFPQLPKPFKGWKTNFLKNLPANPSGECAMLLSLLKM
jgi:hypothetical protein